MSEKQTCPRRMGEDGPWEYRPDLDAWDTDRWSVDREAVRRRHDAEDAKGLAGHNERNAARGEPPITLDEYRTKWHVRGASNDLWLWPWGPPRTCSFCGSLHPDDVLKLLEEGWENEKAKEYKGYLNPPGTRTRHQAFLASIRDQGREPGQGVPSVWTPTPPTKFYVMHFSKEQIARLNELIGKER